LRRSKTWSENSLASDEARAVRIAGAATFVEESLADGAQALVY